MLHFILRNRKSKLKVLKLRILLPYDINSGDITNKVKIITEQKIDLKQTYKVKIENFS